MGEIRRPAPLESITMQKRHGKNHFANINYGYILFFVSVAYVVFLILLRRIIKSYPSNKNRTFFGELWKRLYTIDPALHLLILFIPLMATFYYHYSIFSQTAVYIMRLGRLSYVLLSLNLFLNLRPNIFFRDKYVYTDFIPFHKWLSRLIVIFGLLHGVFFVIRWAINPKTDLDAKLSNKYNFAGVVIAGISIILIIASMNVARRSAYNLFYIIHNITLFAFVFITPYHARPSVKTPYLFVNSVLIAIQVINKIVFTSRASLIDKIEDRKNTNLVVLKFPRKALPDFFNPSSHIRLSAYRKLNPLYWILPSHPYTLATLPSDEIVELIVNEHTVPQFNTSSFVVELGYSYTIQNPHNPSVPDVCLQNANRIAIVCGGSGIAFGLPLFRFFKSMKNISYLRLVWLTKNSSQLSIITKSDSFRALISEDGKIDNLDIYLTNKTTAPTSSGTEGTENDIELEDFELNTAEDLTEYKKLCNITEGERMDWTTELSSLVEEDTSKTWLLACGPEGLVTDGKYYANANGIHFASEVYTL